MHPAAVAISPDGALIVVAMANFNRGQNSGELVVLDAASRATLAVLLKSKSFEIVSAAISPDGSRLAAIDSNGELYMWDITVLTKGAGK